MHSVFRSCRNGHLLRHFYFRRAPNAHSERDGNNWHDLITKTNSTRLQIQPALKQELAALLTSTTKVARVEFGDEGKPIGNGKATGLLILSNASGNRLGIRLRDLGDDKFESLGFWIPSDRKQ
jgi:hypothetical protein